MIIMHMRGNPKTMQLLTNYNSESEDGGGGGGVVSGVARELMQRSGIPRWFQVVNLGIGFAKDMDGNLALLKGADTLRQSCDNLPFLFGPSLKRFIGKIAGGQIRRREFMERLLLVWLPFSIMIAETMKPAICCECIMSRL